MEKEEDEEVAQYVRKRMLTYADVCGRMLLQLQKYERMEKEEDEEVAQYVRKRNALRLKEMTDHLFEWTGMLTYRMLTHSDVC